MLEKFTVENYASFYNINTLSMETIYSSYPKRFNAYEVKSKEYLKSLFIFGKNGSGKSNLVSGIKYMKSIVLSEVDLQVKLIKLLESLKFSFSTEAMKKPTIFEIIFTIDNITYEYGFHVLDGKIDKEYLYKKYKRKILVYSRVSPDYRDIKLSSDMDNVGKLLKNTREDSLFLSWAAMGNNRIAMDIKEWFSRLLVIDSNNLDETLDRTVRFIERSDENKKIILKFMKNLDIDIENFRLEIEERNLSEELGKMLNPEYFNKLKKMPNQKSVDLKIKHQIYNEDWELVENIFKEMSFESDGTKKIFEISGPIIDVFENGGVLVMDEIESKLHPILVSKLVDLINSQNSKGQFIFTTHSIFLLEKELRREQYAFIDKDKFGVSKYFNLSQFKGLRKDSNLLKGYLNGEFNINKLK